MGEAASIIKAFSCDACARFVFNSCHFHSQCVHNCCEVDFTTDKVEIPSDDNSELSIEVDGCFKLHDK